MPVRAVTFMAMWKQAALHGRARPHTSHGLGDTAPAVAHQDPGRGDTAHEQAPDHAVLVPGHPPADHMAIGHRDQDHSTPVQPDPVDLHHVMTLPHQGHGRHQRPD